MMEYMYFNSSSSNGTSTEMELVDYDNGIFSSGNDTYYPYPDYGDSDYIMFIYEGFDFERPIYVYIWEILVVLTTIFNIIVIVVFMRRRMRNATHLVLVAIAISDSLTGLVTLPTYIFVYSHYEPGTQDTKDAYVVEKEWCNAFMISKFFLSKWFHTFSIWLTLFLGIQRFISVTLPLKAKIHFTKKKTVWYVTAIFILSPVLHIYHLVHPKADEHGMCQWALTDKWALVYLWATLLLMHLIPCIMLVLFTALMIRSLFSSTSRVMAVHGANRRSAERRNDWNRRLSIIVSTIVIVFLIPEIPYGIFELYTVLRKHYGKKIMNLHTNRAFHAVYEILLVFSFHANFWIYTVLNKGFRSELKKTCRHLLNTICTVFGKQKRLIPTSESCSSKVNSEPEHIPLNNQGKQVCQGKERIETDF